MKLCVCESVSAAQSRLIKLKSNTSIHYTIIYIYVPTWLQQSNNVKGMKNDCPLPSVRGEKYIDTRHIL